MLISKTKQSVRDLAGREDTAQAIVTVPVNHAAANADSYSPSEILARRQRRLRRMDFSAQQANIGWRISAW